MDYKIEEFDNNITISCTHKIATYIIKATEEESIKTIKKYCEEKNIIPNIIDEDKLELVLKLGIQELKIREMKKNNIDIPGFEKTLEELDNLNIRGEE